MDHASKLLDLCTCYTKLMVRVPQGSMELQKKEKEFLDAVADFEEAALPPFAKFLYAYVGLQKKETPENAAKYLKLLEEAWNEGSVEAGLFLIEIHRNESRLLPESLKDPERSRALCDKLVNKNTEDESGDGSSSEKSPLSFFIGRKDKVEIKYNDEKSSEKPIEDLQENDKKDAKELSPKNSSDKEDSYWDSVPSPALKITHPEKIALDLKGKIDIEELLRPLDDLPGLRDIKSQVRQTVVYGSAIRRRREAGLNVRNLNLHLVFSGNPGTGKTTIARMLGQILYRGGILKYGHVVETDRTDLIGQYVGQTTNWTKRACGAALGGILFIDEAYSIAETPWYSDECIDTLVKFMEDHADEFMVIAAGYSSKMDSFIRSNPGLRSRFQQKISFRDYTFEEMAGIFKGFCRQYEYTLDSFAEQKLMLALKALKMKEKAHFANGRSVRNLFDACIKRQALRIERDDITGKEELMRLLAQDIDDSEGGNSGGDIVYLKA